MRITRLRIENYKSIGTIDLNDLDSVVTLVGANNAGKSNILDCFRFFQLAGKSVDQAWRARGGSFDEVIHQRNRNLKIKLIAEFTVDSEVRVGLIQQLFSTNKHLKHLDILPTEFLTKIVLEASLGVDSASETLHVPGLLPSPGVPLIQYNYSNGQGLAQCHKLDEFCEHFRPGVQIDIQPDKSSISGAPSPSRAFGDEERFRAFKQPIASRIATDVHGYFSNLQWVSPIRKSQPKMTIEGKSEMDDEGANLVDVLHWLKNNKPVLFDAFEAEMKRIIPGLGRMFTPTQGNSATLGVMDVAGGTHYYSLSQLSHGIRSTAMMVAKVLATDPEIPICIEEPEAHLHPKAQHALFDFLKRQASGRQIWVATHSSVIASTAPIQSVVLVSRDKEQSTTAERMTEDSIPRIIEELGIRPSFNFEADVIVFLEGLHDPPVFRAWARKFKFRGKVDFVDTEGFTTLHYFANAKVALSKQVKSVVFVVFDGDTTRDEKRIQIRNKLQAQLKVPADQVLTLEANEVEGCLLDAKAIRLGFREVTLTEDELEARLSEFRTKRDQKGPLDRLCQEFGIGRYDGAVGARIAEAMQTLPAPIAKAFESINAKIPAN